MLRQIPQILNDAFLSYGNDLLLSGVGDLLLTNQITLSEQRVIRRLLTATNSYIWHSSYGAGLPAYVGEALSTQIFSQIRSTIKSQISLEASVSQDPPPVIEFQTIQNGLYCQIAYNLSPLQQPIIINFDVNPLGTAL